MMYLLKLTECKMYSLIGLLTAKILRNLKLI